MLGDRHFGGPRRRHSAEGSRQYWRHRRQEFMVSCLQTVLSTGIGLQEKNPVAQRRNAAKDSPEIQSCRAPGFVPLPSDQQSVPGACGRRGWA